MYKLFFIVSATILGVGFPLLRAQDAEFSTLIRKNVLELKERSVIEQEPVPCQEDLKLFYHNRNYAIAWNHSRMDQLIKALSRASQEGLEPQNYHLTTIKTLNQGSKRMKLEKRIHLDLLATDAFLLYATHLSRGKTDPEFTDCDWYIPTDTINALKQLEQAIETSTVGQTLSNLAPTTPLYTGLKKILILYEKLKENGGWDTIPSGLTMEPGEEDDRVLLVRKRLIVTGDLKKNGASDSKIFDETLEEAIRNFQQRHGLETDGRIGKHTIAAMNKSVDERILQIKISLERCRWFTRTPGPYYLAVNIPGFYMEVVKDGKTEQQYKVVVGMPDRQTPCIRSRVSHIVLHPTWTIPPNILEKDIIPAIQKDSNYLVNRNIRISDFNGVPLASTGKKWTVKNARGFNYVQDPGGNNPLGKVKFLLPNNYHIYLHDTPAQSKFELPSRALSSGCVRVQNAMQLAENLLDDPDRWNKEQLNKALEKKTTQYILLRQQPMIYILYYTSWLDENGIVQFREDVYEKDVKIEHAMQQALFTGSSCE